MRSGAVRQLLTKVGLLPLKDPARPEEPQAVRGSSRHRIPALVVLLVIAGLAGQPLATAPSKAKLFPPGKEPYQIPLRWCALKGSPAVTDAGLPGKPNTTSVLLQRQMRANRIWTPRASITFRSPFTAVDSPSSAKFPVIDDPRPPRVGIGCPGPDCNTTENGRLGPVKSELGDIVVPREGVPASFDEWNEARAECEEEWDHMAQPPPLGLGVSMKGTIALNIREFVEADGSPSTTIGRAAFPTIFTAAGAEDPMTPVLPGVRPPPTELRRSGKRSWAWTTTRVCGRGTRQRETPETRT
jgi:hypothetical protein